MTAADLPQPVPRFGPQFEDRPVLAVGRDEVPRRAGGRSSPPTPRTPPRRPRGSSAWSTRSCRRSSRSPRPSTRPRRSSRTRPLPARTTRWPRPTSSASTGSAGATSTAAHAPTSSSSTRYTFPMVTHFAIEPHAFMAAPDGDGIAVWSTIQHPNWLQKIIAEVLGLPLVQGAGLRPGPGRRLRRQAARQVRAARGASRRSGPVARCASS